MTWALPTDCTTSRFPPQRQEMLAALPSPSTARPLQIARQPVTRTTPPSPECGTFMSHIPLTEVIHGRPRMRHRLCQCNAAVCCAAEEPMSRETCATFLILPPT